MDRRSHVCTSLSRHVGRGDTNRFDEGGSGTIFTAGVVHVDVPEVEVTHYTPMAVILFFNTSKETVKFIIILI